MKGLQIVLEVKTYTIRWKQKKRKAIKFSFGVNETNIIANKHNTFQNSNRAWEAGRLDTSTLQLLDRGEGGGGFQVGFGWGCAVQSSKIRPRWAAHTRIGILREYPSPPPSVDTCLIHKTIHIYKEYTYTYKEHNFHSREVNRTLTWCQGK